MNKKHLLVASAALATMVATDATTAHADETKANATVASQATEGTKTTDSVQTLASASTADATDKSAVEADEKADTEKTETETDAKDEAEKTETETDTKDDAEKVESETEATEDAAKPKVDAPVKEAPKSVEKKATPVKPTQKKATPAKAVAPAKSVDKQKYLDIADRYYQLSDDIFETLMGDPAFLAEMSDSELEAFMNTYYYNIIDMYYELLAFVEVNGADDDLLEALEDMTDYLNNFEDIFDYVFDDYFETGENSSEVRSGQGVSINPDAIGATNHNTADTRMAKYHGQANTLPETASDQQNGLAIAGAALLAGLGALGFAKKRA